MSNERLPIPVLFLTLFWLDFPIWFQTYLTVLVLAVSLCDPCKEKSGVI